MGSQNFDVQPVPLIVGVGASAGGLEAFRDLFSRLSGERGIALVLVQHLDPNHESLLQDLLSKRTAMPVQTVEDRMKVEPGNIYLIPPGSSLTIKDGELRLADFESPRGQRRPIDKFLESLAKDQQGNAVAIILSGTGSDGSAGVRAIKEHGGLTIAQDPNEAAYDGMPRSAIGTGAADLTLSVAEIADVLADYRARRGGIEPAIESERDFLTQVFKQVRYHTGHDFTQYKQSTLLRRLTVRMSAIGISSPAKYIEKLLQDRAEAYRLQRDVLINVTGFFRDPEAFEMLRREYLPELLAGRGSNEHVRIWVPGCSTGEEAYTIGMLVASELRKSDANPEISIFGTDIDEDALQVARLGHYPNTAADEIPAEFLEEYMVPTTTGYEVSKFLRKLVRFSQQSLIKDPPFSKLDMVSCRNLLIYFERPLQDQAMRVFAYALKPGGVLFLGTSESGAAQSECFDDGAPSQQIYIRNDIVPAKLDIPMNRAGIGLTASDRPRSHDLTSAHSLTAVRNAIAQRHSAPFLVASNDGKVTHASKGAERYLKVQSGDFRQDLGALIHPSLESVIRRLNNQSLENEGDISAVRFDGDLDGITVSLEVTSERLPTGERFFVFHESGTTDIAVDRRMEPSSGDESVYVRELEQELDDARQRLRTTIEELETSNEELKSSNEEMMSMNEELQSGNEELSTINDELQNTVAQVNAANADLNGYIASTGLATVFLDENLQVRRYTPAATEYFRLVEADHGRAIADISSDVSIETLVECCQEAMKRKTVVERELTTIDERYNLIARAVGSTYGEDDKSGVVFTLIDVTELRRNAADLEEARKEAQRGLSEVEELYNVSPTAMALYDPGLRYVRVNQRLADINGLPIAAHIGKTIEEIVPDLGEAVIEPVRQVFATGEPILQVEITGVTAGNPDEERAWIVDWYPLRSEDEVVAVGVNVRDVTTYKQMQADLQRIMRELQHRVKNMLGNVTALINRAKRDKGDPAVVLQTLFDRIKALAKTHQLLTSENWHSTELRDILLPELTKVYGEDAVTLVGPNIRCNSRATLSLGMAIHELATNAAKYGSLSVPEGRLDVRWARIDEGEGERLRLTWKESGGPKVTEPANEGFGSSLISSTIERTLGGEISIEWAQSGLIGIVSIPIDNVTDVNEQENEHLF